MKYEVNEVYFYNIETARMFRDKLNERGNNYKIYKIKITRTGEVG